MARYVALFVAVALCLQVSKRSNFSLVLSAFREFSLTMTTLSGSNCDLHPFKSNLLCARHSMQIFVTHPADNANGSQITVVLFRAPSPRRRLLRRLRCRSPSWRSCPRSPRTSSTTSPTPWGSKSQTASRLARSSATRPRTWPATSRRSPRGYKERYEPTTSLTLKSL